MFRVCNATNLFRNFGCTSRKYSDHCGLLIETVDGEDIFANLYLQAVLLDCKSVPQQLVKMIHNVAFALAQNPLEDTELKIPRKFALMRWFYPWLGIDLLDGEERSQIEYEYLRKGKAFLELFNSKFPIALKSWERRKVSVPQDEISTSLSMLSHFYLIPLS
jgi:hypothetical protein